MTFFSKTATNKNNQVDLLIADDHPLIRQCISSVFDELEDIKLVGEAKDGYQAVEYSFLLKPDVVLMDVEMPGMDGIEATRKIKMNQPGIRIIGFSNNAELSTAQQMLDAGADDYLLKNCSVEKLIETIQGR